MSDPRICARCGAALVPDRAAKLTTVRVARDGETERSCLICSECGEALVRFFRADELADELAAPGA